MATALVTAHAPSAEFGCGEHEQSRARIEIARLARLQGRGVRLQNRLAPWVVGSKPGRIWIVQPAPPDHRVTFARVGRLLGREQLSEAWTSPPSSLAVTRRAALRSLADMTRSREAYGL